MDKLMKMLEAGEMPSVLDLMQALSDISDYWPGPEYEGQEAAGADKPSLRNDLYPPPRCIGCG